MKNFFKKRKKIKELKELLKAAQHAKNMREDVANPLDLEKLDAAKKVAIKSKYESYELLIDASSKLEQAINNVYPFSLRRGKREHIEVLIIAVAAAMAIRAFFIEPFKIPTGSMQPTLNGITIEAQERPTFFDNPILKLPKWLITGASYKEIRVKKDGVLLNTDQTRSGLALNIGGINHYIPFYMCSRENAPICINPLKKYYKKGDIIASARVITGDQIIVNKMKYNFMSPQRGDISVFDTKNIKHAGVRKDTFYIKRMVGMPNEDIRIVNGRIVANEKIVNSPEIFNIISTSMDYSGEHGNGYSNAGNLFDNTSHILLEDRQYLMLGDNTKKGMSLDGRFFGGVPRADFRGPAVFVYWPFRDHWGLIR